MAGLMIDIRPNVGLDTIDDLRIFFETHLLARALELLPEGVSLTRWEPRIFGEKHPYRHFVLYFSKSNEDVLELIGDALYWEFRKWISGYDNT